METIKDNLDEGEKTPDWDSMKLRAHIISLHAQELNMDKPEHDRYLALAARFRGRMRELMPAA